MTERSNPVRRELVAMLDSLGIAWREGEQRKHGCIVVTVKGAERRLVYPGSPSDHRAPLNARAKARRLLREWGANV